jgi:SpoVK/Ycf46/Vps4 family AAA+-type ATPase
MVADRVALAKKLRDTYFHPAAKQIWEMCDAVHHHPEVFTDVGQTASASFILHGPPGTGKTSICKRLAMAYGRHIVSVSLKGMSRAEAYQILQSPAHPSHEGQMTDPKDFLIILEEFDDTVQYLLDENAKPTVQAPREVSDSESSYDSSEEDDADYEVGKKSKSIRRAPVRPRPSDFVSGLTDSSVKLTVNDLLEIVQGPSNLNGWLLFATTNNIGYIRKVAPALVREGRMTPVHIDYLDRETVRQMSLCYVGVDATITVDKLTQTKTSILVEEAMRARATKDTTGYLEVLENAR